MGAYLEFAGPDLRWRVVNEAAREVTLDTTNHIVVLGVGTLPESTQRQDDFTRE
jgi:hypothetical protein